MAHKSCPKCGFQAEIADECPRCGVYISKFLAAAQRRPPGASPSGPPGFELPGGGVRPSGHVPAGAPSRQGSSVGALVGWIAAVLILGLVGYVVFGDWLGSPISYTAPPGWQRMGDDAVDQATDQMPSGTRSTSTLHALYSLAGQPDQGPIPPGIGIGESEQQIPMTAETAGQIRATFEMLGKQPQLAGMTVARVELAEYGGRKAIEVQYSLKIMGTDMSRLEVMFGAERSTFTLAFSAPPRVFREHIEAVRASLESFRIVRGEGIRGIPWVKHGLRWSFFLAVVVMLFALVGRLRGRD